MASSGGGRKDKKFKLKFVKVCEGVFVQKTASLALLENIVLLETQKYFSHFMMIMKNTIMMMMKMMSVHLEGFSVTPY